MYERHHVPPVPTGRFVLRLLRHAAFAFTIVALSLLIGIAGYMRTEGMTMLDAFLNAAMLLGGMGPVKTEGLSDQGKMFAGVFALYSGLVFIAVMSIMLAPVVHRVMHRFHWEETEGSGGQPDADD
jgi:hypothetical protein